MQIVREETKAVNRNEKFSFERIERIECFVCIKFLFDIRSGEENVVFCLNVVVDDAQRLFGESTNLRVTHT